MIAADSGLDDDRLSVLELPEEICSHHCSPPGVWCCRYSSGGVPKPRTVVSRKAPRCRRYLDRVDRALWSEGFSIVRYMDNVAVVAESSTEARRQLDCLRRALARVGLTLSAVSSVVCRRVFLAIPVVTLLVGSARRNATGLPELAMVRALTL